MTHLLVVVGWDLVGLVWWLECQCGWSAGSLFMGEVGEAFDDHLRLAGVLVDE